MIVSLCDEESMRMAQLYCSNNNSVVGLTSGTFDLLHDYHLKYLERCRRLCGILIVGVDSDIAVKAVKGSNRPIMSEFQRLSLVDANKYVTFCYIQERITDLERVAETLMSDGGCIFRNQEFLGREDEVVGGSLKVQVVIVPDICDTNSTTDIIGRVWRVW